MKKHLTFAKLMMIVMMAILPLSFYAQKKQNVPVERYFYIFAEGGLSVNHTDLANYGFVPFYQDGKFVLNDGYVFNNFDGAVGIGYQLGKVIGINGIFGTGRLAGRKYGQLLTENGGNIDYLNLELAKTSFMEANLNLTFNLTNLFFGYNPRRVFNFIPHIGIGGIRYASGQVNQLPDQNETEGTGTFLLPAKEHEMTFTVPVGAELNFNVSRKLDIFIDYTFTWAGNDKIDQVEKVFYPESKPGERVIDDIQVVNDMYSHVNLGLRYKFNKKPCDIEKMARESGRISYRVNPDPLVEGEDGNVCFDVIITVPGEYFEKEAVMNLQPYIAYNGGQINIDPITFAGENVKGGCDFRVNYKEGGEYTKHYCMPYQPEMENSKLMAEPMFYVYEGTIYPTQDEIVKNQYFTQGATETLADGVIAKPIWVEQTVYDTITKVHAVKKLTYFFNKGKYNISDRRKLNADADAAFRDLLNADVKEIEIRAWASPEGEEGLNNELSNNRANAADKQMKDLIKKAKAEGIEINGKGYGPDWNTFVELVQNSNIADKDQIVRVIQNSKNREQEIKNMINVYPELENDILPLLRRAEIYVNESYEEVVTRTVKVKVEK